MELRKLRCFVILAEELNFTRAAERCHLGQPALSKLIAASERELGVTLFERDKRNVTLTAAGRRFLTSARATLEEYERGVQAVRQSAEPPQLRLAFGAYLYGMACANVLQLFRETYPDISIVPLDAYSGESFQALLTGRADVGIVMGFDETGDLHQELFSSAAIYAYLPSQHPLASRAHVRLNDLEGETLLMWDRSPQTIYIAFLKRTFAALGVHPRIRVLGDTELSPSIRSVWEMVAAGEGIHLSPIEHGWVFGLPTEGVTRLPLLNSQGGAQKYDLLVTWRERSMVVDAFLKVLEGWRKARDAISEGPAT